MTYLQTMQNNKSVTCSCMPNSQQTFILKTSFVFIFRRRLDQDKYVRLSFTSSEDVFKCLGQGQYIRLGHTSSRRLQDVLKTPSRRLAKTSSRHLQDVFKMSCKDIFKTFSRRIIRLNCSC